MQSGLFQSKKTSVQAGYLSLISPRVLPHSIVVLFVLLVLQLIAPVVEAGELPSFDRVRILAKPPRINDVELIDHNGQPFRLAELRGRPALILFGFTHCPEVCPTGMAQLSQLARSAMLDPENVSYIMISVDGERDTPAVMDAYLKSFSPEFIGLTADPLVVKTIAKNFSAAFYKGNVIGDQGDYDVSHSPQIFAVDASGYLRAEFYNASNEAMAAVTEALLKETGNTSG